MCNVGEIEQDHIVTNPNTALVVRRIKDDLTDTLVFRNKYEIAISDILISPVCFLKVKPKVNKKSRETRPAFIAYLLSDGYPIQKLEIPNLKFEIPN